MKLSEVESKKKQKQRLFRSADSRKVEESLNKLIIPMIEFGFHPVSFSKHC